MSNGVMYIGDLELCTVEWPPTRQGPSGAWEITTIYNRLVKRALWQELRKKAFMRCPITVKTESGTFAVSELAGVTNGISAELDYDDAEVHLMKITVLDIKPESDRSCQCPST